MMQLKRIIEGATLLGAVFLPAGTDSSIWCAAAGTALYVLFGLEIHRWEEGRRGG